MNQKPRVWLSVAGRAGDAELKFFCARWGEGLKSDHVVGAYGATQWEAFTNWHAAVQRAVNSGEHRAS